MKKNIKFIGVAAAALMAVAPIATSSGSVLAADNVTSSTVTTSDNYFSYNNKKLENGAIVPLGNGIPVKSGQTIEEILKNIQAEVPFHGTLSEFNKEMNDKYSISSLVNALSNIDGVTVSGRDANSTVSFSDNAVISTMTALYGSSTDGTPIHVMVPLTNQSTNINGPVINVTYTQDGKEITTAFNQQAFQVEKDSSFSPTSFVNSNGNTVKFTATESNKDQKPVQIKVLENTVDTSKAGSYGSVKLSVTASNGDKTDILYKVLVQPEGAQRRQLASLLFTPTYTITNQKVENKLSSNLYQGGKFYVGKETQIIDGVSYTRVSEKSQADANSSSNNRWVETIYLMTPTVEVFEGTMMHKALVYDSGGGSKGRKIAAYKTRTLQKEPITIKGVKYYKIAGAPDFIKAANVTGTTRTLKHNAYIYATSKRRADRTVLKKGTKVTTYGSSYKFKNGKRYYRIEGATKTNKRYVKVANFK